MRGYTIEGGRITEGALVVPKVLASGVTIPVVMVGEQGRGRKLSFLPVELTNKFDGQDVIVYNCTIGQTLKGGHKLIEITNDNDTDNCLVVLRTPIGFRGSNNHTGDRVPNSDPIQFLPFPCKILTEGVIAQGTAGRMGSGQQLIAIAQKGVIFRTSYSGRLYGKPSSHYYVFTGDRILVATWDERVATDIF